MTHRKLAVNQLLTLFLYKTTEKNDHGIKHNRKNRRYEETDPKAEKRKRKKELMEQREDKW